MLRFVRKACKIDRMVIKRSFSAKGYGDSSANDDDGPVKPTTHDYSTPKPAKSNENTTKPDLKKDYGMGEDWMETGKAIKDRTGEVLKESINAGKDALGPLTGSSGTSGSAKSTGDDNPAKQHPPQSVNEYDVKENLKDMKEAVKSVKERVKETVGKEYDKIDPVNEDNTIQSDTEQKPPVDFYPDRNMPSPDDDIQFKDKRTKEAYEKGKQLRKEEEPMKGL